MGLHPTDLQFPDKVICLKIFLQLRSSRNLWMTCLRKEKNFQRMRRILMKKTMVKKRRKKDMFQVILELPMMLRGLNMRMMMTDLIINNNDSFSMKLFFLFKNSVYIIPATVNAIYTNC